MVWIKIGVFILGVLLGGILNSFITWWPQEKEGSGPQAACPHCGHSWYGLEKVRLWGLVFSQGRCHYCGDHVPLRYILVELATGVLLVLAFSRGKGTVDMFRLLAFILLLVPLFFIDLKHHRLPNILTLPGIGLGLLLSASLGQIKSSILGALTGGGLLFIASIATRGGLGMGDAKLQAMVGAFLGLKAMLISLAIGVILGGIVAFILLALQVRGRKDMIPYGPFLITGALLVSLVIVTG